MSTVAKILVVLNLALAVFFLASASNYLGQQDTFKKQLTDEKAAHNTTRELKDSEIVDLRGRLQSAGQEINKLQQEREVAKAENSRISSEITHLREAYNQLSENATRAQRAVDQLTNSLNASRDMNGALQSDNNNLRDNLKSAQEDRDAKVAMVNSLQQQLRNETEKGKGLEAQLSDAQDANKRQGFELRYFKEKFPGMTAGSQPAHSGRILAANNDANVYVISLGEEDGVKAGFQYIVSRGAEYVATIQINDVQAKQAAGSAVKALSKGGIQRGDSVMNAN